jgi:hypothetical protein
MDDPSRDSPSKPVFGTVREQGLRLRMTVALAPAIAIIVLVGLHDLGAALTAGGLLAIGMGITALGFGHWIKPTEAVHTMPRQRATIKLSTGLALLAALGGAVTKSGTIGYVAFGLALVAGAAGMWLFVGPRKRAAQPTE